MIEKRYKDMDAETKREVHGMIKAGAMAADQTAVYNLAEIRKLEDRIKQLEAVVYAEGPDVRREDCVP